MPHSISRRHFLKAGVGIAIGAAASQVPVKPSHAAQAKPLATLLDIRKCIACGACVEACRETSAEKFPEPKKPFPQMYPKRVKVEDWSDRRDVDDRLTPYNWLYIQSTEVTKDGEPIEVNIPRRCMHCENPPCVKLCPWGAARQFDNGISKLDADLCMGGAKCRTVCPWKIPQRQTGVGLYLDLLPNLAGNGVMYKCDRCYDQIAKGDPPACIDACPEGVQSIGPRQEIIEQAHRLAKEIDGHIYGEMENGGTNTIYVSPVPFEALNAAIETGKGKPHLGPARDAMANSKHQARAMMLAPLAGIAAAVGKFYHSSRK